MMTLTREEFLAGFDHAIEIDDQPPEHSCLEELSLVESGGLIEAICNKCGATARIGK